YPEQLVRLQAQAPLRMGEAESDGGVGIRADVEPVHGLQKEVVEPEVREIRWIQTRLWKNELQLVAAFESPVCARLGTHANPVESTRRFLRAVRLDGDLEAHRVKGV